MKRPERDDRKRGDAIRGAHTPVVRHKDEHHKDRKDKTHVKVSGKPVAVRRRTWSPDCDVALCSARAVAEAIRIASGPVLSDADVLALHWAAGGDRETGAAILDVLSAARERCGGKCSATELQAVPAIWQGYGLEPSPGGESNPATSSQRDAAGAPGIATAALILGVDLPDGQPHAVAVGPDGTWWSWGEPCAAEDFPGAVIEEAWAVTWR